MDLIPGLPNDVALECLLRIPSQSLVLSRRVSRGWKAEIERPDFIHRRKAIGKSQIIIVVMNTPKSVHYSYVSKSPYQLAFCEPETGEWSDLPPIPNCPELMLSRSHLLPVGSKLVVLGGGEKSSHVFIYDFLTRTCRRGAPMPEIEYLYACASDYDRTVYVACGFNKYHMSAKAFAYNVEEDEWTRLPDMNIGRALCTRIYQDGKFHVIGGVRGKCCLRSKETYDVAIWEWGAVEEDFSEISTPFPKCVTNQHNGKIYMCEEGNVSVREGAKWRVLARLPKGMNNVLCKLGTTSFL